MSSMWMDNKIGKPSFDSSEDDRFDGRQLFERLESSKDLLLPCTDLCNSLPLFFKQLVRIANFVGHAWHAYLNTRNI